MTVPSEVSAAAAAGRTHLAARLSRRLVDPGAIVAGWVGIGLAISVAVSFLLVIPIEPIYWLLTPLAGLLIGYYADQRSATLRGSWRRIVANALYAGLVTGLTLALLLLAVKALFFFADSGFPQFNRIDAQNRPIPPYCDPGAGCVYARYLADGRGPGLKDVGVTDAASFGAFYWNQQLTTAAMLFALSLATASVGGVVYGVTNPRSA